MTTLHTSRPSTASSTDNHHGQGTADPFEPALEGPPSPEGIRAFSRRMRRGASAGYKNETQPSSGSSSRSDTPESSTGRLVEPSGLSRNPSQRSSVMPLRDLKDRPESVQFFGKSVFSRRPKLRKEHSDLGIPNSSLHSLSQTAWDNTGVEQPREQRSIHSMFTRRRPRGTSETSQKKLQISGPYGFQHVSHSVQEGLPGLGQTNNGDLAPGAAVTRLQALTDAPDSTTGLTQQDLDKPLPTPPGFPNSTRSSSEDSLQRSPPASPSRVYPESHMSPIPPPPRTSSRMSVRNDSADSFSALIFDRPAGSSCLRQVQAFVSLSNEGLRAPTTMNILEEGDGLSGNEGSPRKMSGYNISAWPLSGSMTSLPEEPEEEEYHLTTTHTCTSFMGGTMSLRGSVSVPHLRRISFGQTTQRPPSNASDTLGRFDLASVQRALHESDAEEVSEEPLYRHSWEDDIDYCYDHAAEADCDFAWDRPSCDMERGEEDYAESLILGEDLHSSASSFRGFSSRLLSVDLPALSPTSYRSRSTNEAVTPTSATMPSAANFSLPRIDSSTKLRRELHRTPSSTSSFQESQGFSLSPSLLIPDDYHEQMLRYERGDLSSHASTEDLKAGQQDDLYVNFTKTGTYLPARCSASTTVSTLSEQSNTSSRYASSTFSSAFTRWTGSSTSSWQHSEPCPQPVAITLNDKESILAPESEVAVAVAAAPQEPSREGHVRAHSEATLLLSLSYDKTNPLSSKASKEQLKTHRRARTASRSHTATSPQFALFPQIPPQRI
ncbi:hypothetical protein F5Y17DRAFT_462846 [Xylariaceae sp. FL0594]|nr:hypothetical protein F5Y17DRAFT_462846 [Xylariaceae sp. FL0594]